MKQEHIDQLSYLSRLYGTYEVAKALKNIAVATSDMFHQHGNDEAIIHKDVFVLESACRMMALSHPLRANDV